MFLERPIAEGELVKTDLDGFAFNGEVLLCRLRGDEYEAHVSLKDVNDVGLRRAPRFPVNLAAKVCAPSLPRPVAARIVDISGYGIGIELPEPLPVEGIVAVKSEANTALGIVRHCRKLPSGCFRVGIELHHTLVRETEGMGRQARWRFLSKVRSALGWRRESPGWGGWL